MQGHRGYRGVRAACAAAHWHPAPPSGADRWPYRALPLEPAVAEPVLALGFDVGQPDSLLYAEATRFSLDLPPERIGT